MTPDEPTSDPLTPDEIPPNEPRATGARVYATPTLRTGGSLDEHHLGDFTMTPESLRLIPLALLSSVLATAVAVILLDLIGFFTNLFYFGRLDVRLGSPAGNQLGLFAVVVPIFGGIVVGLMARYGSEKIRGHGIPEAMEAILTGGSKVDARVAALKPTSSAIAIGTGGPFGAEGPIIMTGGALGSLVAQSVRLSASERKILLVAGACAGMTAVFASPVAATLLGVELLLFEWKPRSLIPVAAACALAQALRILLADAGLIAAAPLFPVPAHASLAPLGLLSALVIGLVCGGVAWLVTICVYGAEDGFRAIFGRRGIHWMWWPAIGGLVIGLGGLVEPRALGVGYDSIRAELAGQIAFEGLLAIFVVKLIIWAVGLGSGTSGGVIAPVLLMGGAVGGLLAPILPGGPGSPAVDVGLWCMLGMAATLGGVYGTPFTAIVFALELTRDLSALPALLIACVAAYAVSVLVLKRSILTEKIARRGFHVMREYVVDPLDALFVRDVMATHVLTVEADRPARGVSDLLNSASGRRRQRLYPVLQADRLVGVIGSSELHEAVDAATGDATVGDLMQSDIAVAFPDETLHAVAERMSEARVGVMPVISRGADPELRGLVNQFDLFQARDRLLEEERHREQILRIRFLPVGGFRRLMGPPRSSDPSGDPQDAEAGSGTP